MTTAPSSNDAVALHTPESRPALLRPALVLLVLLSALTGLAYPLAVTGLAQSLFPVQSAGSLIVREGQTVGSALIGQEFTQPGEFWGRVSATAPTPYNGSSSGGANLGPTSPALKKAVQARVAALRAADPGNSAAIPVDLVTSSGSGLDPHLSVAGALYQAGRVARARHLPLTQVQALIAQHTEGRLLGLLGEPRVNVLELNLALKALPGQ